MHKILIQMSKRQYIPEPLTIEVEYPKSFLDLFQSTRKDNPFIGYGNPAAKILIIGQEVTWDMDEHKQEYYHYCLKNFRDWQENIKHRNITIQGDIQHPEDGVTTEAFERFNPLYPHYLRYNKRMYIRNKDWHTFNYGASSTWINYQKLIDYICKKSKPEIIDFVRNSFITELSELSRPHNIVIKSSSPNENVLEEKKKQAKATEESISRRCALLNEPFYSQFPIIIMACGPYASKIFPYTFGLGEQFKKEQFEQKKDYKVYRTNDRIIIWTRQLSDHRGNKVPIKLLEDIANEVRPYLKK